VCVCFFVLCNLKLVQQDFARPLRTDKPKLPAECSSRGNMGSLSDSTFGLGISEIFEFRSIGNLGISSRNLGVSVRHLESWNIFGTFFAVLEFRSVLCF